MDRPTLGPTSAASAPNVYYDAKSAYANKTLIDRFLDSRNRVVFGVGVIALAVAAPFVGIKEELFKSK